MNTRPTAEYSKHTAEYSKHTNRPRPVVVVKSASPVTRLSQTPPTPTAPPNHPLKEYKDDKENIEEEDLLTLLHPALSFDATRNLARSSSKDSLLLPCPNCYKTVLTEVRPVEWGWWLCGCGEGEEEAEHRCPSCKVLIATFY